MRGLWLLAVACLALAVAPASEAAKAWSPLEVDVWDPPFNSERKRRMETYAALDRAAKAWRICVAIPHLKDAYWNAVNFAVIDAAKRLGVAVRLYEAGGYAGLDVQRQQIEECMGSGADGLIIGSISADGLNDLVDRYAAEGKPVIDLINGMSAGGITARAAVDFWDNANQAGEYLKKSIASPDRALRVAWFPGPRGAGWSAAGDTGLRAAAADGGIEIVDTRWGDTGRAAQAELVQAALAAHPDIDVVLGTAVTAEAAVDILRQTGLTKTIRVMAYYYSPGVHSGIRRGQILAAPSDQQAIQTRLAMDLVVRAMEGKPYPRHVAPRVVVVDRDSMRTFDASSSLPPRGFRPIFSVDDWQ